MSDAFRRERFSFRCRALAAAGCLFLTIAAARAEDFPAALTRFQPGPKNPVFTAEGSGHWDVKIRERGWIIRDADGYHLWFTGYDGTRAGEKHLGYASSADGIEWKRHSSNPIIANRWVEDVMIAKTDGKYHMFAESADDHAQLFESTDRIHWTWKGLIDIRLKNGTPIPPGPYGTPTAWNENGNWHLFYERHDLGVWLATSADLKVFTNVADEPVLTPGPAEYDRALIAVNQVLRYDGKYYLCYHGSPGGASPVPWTSNIAESTDLIHWKKFPGNPLRPISENKSSNLLINDGKQFRLYTMHESVQVHFPIPAGK